MGYDYTVDLVSGVAAAAPQPGGAIGASMACNSGLSNGSYIISLKQSATFRRVGVQTVLPPMLPFVRVANSGVGDVVHGRDGDSCGARGAVSAAAPGRFSQPPDARPAPARRARLSGRNQAVGGDQGG